MNSQVKNNVIANWILERCDIPYNDVMKMIEDESVPTTTFDGPHSLDYCLICNPTWDGEYGVDGTESIAKVYFINDSSTPAISGWIGICSDCIRNFTDDSSLVVFEDYEGHPVFGISDTIEHECTNPTWHIESLVSEPDSVHRFVRCDECGYWGVQFNPFDRIVEIGPVNC